MTGVDGSPSQNEHQIAFTRSHVICQGNCAQPKQDMEEEINK